MLKAVSGDDELQLHNCASFCVFFRDSLESESFSSISREIAATDPEFRLPVNAASALSNYNNNK